MKQGLKRTLAVLSGACLGLAILCLAAPAFGAQTVVAYNAALGEFPVSVAIDWLGNKYVSLQPICEVRRYDARWRQTHTFTLPCDKTNGDMGSGLAVEPWGTFYVGIANTKGGVGNQGVYEVQPWGSMRRLPGTEKMLFPDALAFDHLFGTLYVTDLTKGQVWRIRPNHPAEVWSDAPELFSPAGFGANGLAVHRGYVFVSVTYPALILRIRIQPDGSAGTVETLVDTPTLNANKTLAVDDIALDVLGNIYVSVGVGIPPGGPTPAFYVLKVSPDGKELTFPGAQDGLTASVTSLAFDSCWGHSGQLLVTINQAGPPPGLGGTGSAVMKLDVGVTGEPLP